MSEELEIDHFISDEAESFCEEWTKKFNDSKCLIINEATKQRAKSFEAEINMSFLKLRNIIFKNKFIDFETNADDLSSNVIGWLDYKTILLPMFDQLESVDIKNLIATNPNFPMRMTILENGKIVVAYINLANTLLIVLFDRNFSLLTQANNATPAASYLNFHLYSYKNITIVQSIIGSFTIEILDENLNRKAFLNKSKISPITFSDTSVIYLEASTL